jgi:hypothetical protein
MRARTVFARLLQFGKPRSQVLIHLWMPRNGVVSPKFSNHKQTSLVYPTVQVCQYINFACLSVGFGGILVTSPTHASSNDVFWANLLTLAGNLLLILT